MDENERDLPLLPYHYFNPQKGTQPRSFKIFCKKAIYFSYFYILRVDLFDILRPLILHINLHTKYLIFIYPTLSLYIYNYAGDMNNPKNTLLANNPAQKQYPGISKKGIRELFTQQSADEQFSLQVIEVILSNEQKLIIFLSDGVSYIKGYFIGEALQTMQKHQGSIINMIIKFSFQDIIMEEKGPQSFRLKTIKSIHSTSNKIYGSPSPYIYEKIKNNPFQAANKLETSHINEFANLNPSFLKIRQLYDMPFGKVHQRIKAKIIRKPDKVTTFMNIEIQDQLKDSIQCCMFGQVISKYKDQLKINNWYIFQGAMLQIHNSKNTKQLKITKESSILRIKNEQQRGSNYSQEYQRPMARQYDKKRQAMPAQLNKTNTKALKEFNLSDHLQGNNTQDNAEYFVIARLYKTKKNLKESMGQSYEAVTRFGNIIEIVIWKQSKYVFDEAQTYQIYNLKKKIYRDQIGLQSIGNRTVVKDSLLKILTRKEYKGEEKQPSFQRKHYTHKSLGVNEIVYSIFDLIQLENKKDQKVYMHAQGFLQINLTPTNFQDSTDLRKKLFFMKCPTCEQNDYNRSARVEPRLSKDQQVVCSNCLSPLQIMWNIKCLFIDHENELSCKINNQIATNMIGLDPQQGMVLFLSKFQKLKNILKKTICFRKGVFKFNCKRNEKKDGQMFYNICQFYADGKKSCFQRAIKELKQTININHQYKDYPILNKQKYAISNQRPIPKAATKISVPSVQQEEPQNIFKNTRQMNDF